VVSQELHLKIDNAVRNYGKEGIISVIEELYDKVEALEKKLSGE